jgi:Domain of unknown function (DUF1707)/2TM domain
MTDREPQMRASDAERERVVERLRGHAAEGRLDLEELETRVDRALAATTAGELDELVRDLPADPPPRPRRSRPRAEVRAYLGVQLMLVAIWALTGMGYFWPVWPMLGWGIPLMAKGRGLGCGRRRRRGHDAPGDWAVRRV